MNTVDTTDTAHVRRGYRWVDRELARMDPETDWERMISLYVGHRVPEFALAMMIYPGTMRMMQPGMGAATLAHTAKLETRPHRRWMFATRWWHEMIGRPGGTGGLDDAFARQFTPGIGAEIMGAGKFGHPGWHEDPEWKGWWGPNPPFHTPTFILTRHPRPSIEMEGGTTFHFLDASPDKALETAREAAGGQDVRIGGGPTVIRDFLAAGLIDHMHIVVVPILLGRGVRLWEGLEHLEKDYEVEATSSPSGVTHVTFTRVGL